MLWVKGWLVMGRSKVILVLAPPSFQLWFENLGEDFSYALWGLKHNCPWMRWDRQQRAWVGSTHRFAQTLSYCRTFFNTDQIVVLWVKATTDDGPRQLQMF